MDDEHKIRGRVGDLEGQKIEEAPTEAPQDGAGGAQPPPTGSVGIRRVPPASRRRKPAEAEKGE